MVKSTGRYRRRAVVKEKKSLTLTGMYGAKFYTGSNVVSPTKAARDQMARI